jgi:Kef-type K+ transport system membrane component KefB
VSTPLHVPVPRWRHPVVLLVFVLVPASAGLLVAGVRGGWSTTVHAAAPVPRPAFRDEAVPALLLAIVVVVVAARLLAALAVRFGQPGVVGEIAAGLLLGPSALGAVLPGARTMLFPDEIVPILGALAELGVIFFMFLVGRELRLDVLRGHGTRCVVIGHAGIAVPFLFGVLVAVFVLDPFRPAGTDPMPFAVFCGVALSVTAFPVLARIVADRGLDGTRIGSFALATGGVSDVLAWCALAFVIAGSALRTMVLTAVFVTLMWTVVRPLLRRLAGRGRGLTVTLLATILVAAAVGELIGIGVIFGAFVAGVCAPRDSSAVTEFADRLARPTMVLTLPLFFAVVGLRTDIGAVLTGAGAVATAAVLVAGVAGKLAGVGVPARLVGLRPRAALGLAVMMNCRGLTEIVVLQLGLSHGLLSGELFTVFVVMALVTTTMTGPLLDRTRQPEASVGSSAVPAPSH